MGEIQCATKSEFYDALKWATDMCIHFTAYTDALIVQINTKEH